MEFTGRLSALQRPAYRRYWLGSFASVGATQLQVMAQGWLVFQLSGSALMLGYLGAAAALPAIVMTLFGGVLADRVNKRRLLMVTSLIVATLLLATGVLDFSGYARAWHVILIAALISFVSGFDWPARQAMFPLLIERQDMMSAVALNSIIWQSCRMVMPAMGGIILAYSDTWVVFMLCAAGFLTMFFVMSGLNIQTPARQLANSTFQHMAEGLTFIMTHRIFLVLISLSYAGMFLVSSYMQLMPAFSELLDAGETGYGYLISITGVGSVIGTLIVGSLQGSRRLGFIILGAALMSGLTIHVFSVTVSGFFAESLTYPLSMLAVFTIALFSSVFMITSMTVLQLQVPDNLRGRVMGFHGITYSLMPLGGLLTGFIATLTSAPVAISISASVYVLLVLVIASTQSSVRRIEGTEKTESA